jgi:hypothetical protein
MRLRPVCLTCVSFDVETVVDGEPAQAEFFACFECQDVFYFMPDAKPRVRQLGLFQLYGEPSRAIKRGRVTR